MFEYGKIIESCSCGTSIYIKTTSGRTYKIECGDNSIDTSNNTLKSNKSLSKVDWPL